MSIVAALFGRTVRRRTQYPDTWAQLPMEAGEAAREAQSVLVGGAMVAGMATGATIPGAAGQPVAAGNWCDRRRRLIESHARRPSRLRVLATTRIAARLGPKLSANISNVAHQGHSGLTVGARAQQAQLQENVNAR